MRHVVEWGVSSLRKGPHLNSTIGRPFLSQFVAEPPLHIHSLVIAHQTWLNFTRQRMKENKCFLYGHNHLKKIYFKKINVFYRLCHV